MFTSNFIRLSISRFTGSRLTTSIKSRKDPKKPYKEISISVMSTNRFSWNNNKNKNQNFYYYLKQSCWKQTNNFRINHRGRNIGRKSRTKVLRVPRVSNGIKNKFTFWLSIPHSETDVVPLTRSPFTLS